ncbi:MAG: FAD-dependent oxidoreductase [Usitatibacter sp.]
MTACDAKLLAREEVAEGTMAFRFEKPPGFVFKPGQAIDVVLPGSPGRASQDSRHAFSLVSAPYEASLVVATRMRDSAFKRALKALPIGDRVQIEGPFGSLTMHKERARPAVFMAGGIGVTPFMSILRQAASDRLPQPLLLLYSNRRPEDAAFLDELQQLSGLNGNFRLLATMTESGKSARPWAGETRLIDEAVVKEAVAGLTAPIFYLAGPPAMVRAMREVLNRGGVEDDDVRGEEFFGY